MPAAPTFIVGVFAAKARIAVLFRRGPKRWTQMILWHTDADRFIPGQWIKHRVDVAELSSDGELLVYSGHDFAKRQKYEQWIAVSRPPYFSALAVWPTRWPGGHGRFAGPRQLELFGFITDRKKDGGKMPLKVVQHIPVFPETPQPATKPPEWYELHPKSGKWRLLWKHARHTEEIDHSVFTQYAVQLGEAHWPLEGVNWAGIDQRSRLILTRAGKLFAATVTPVGIQEKELADFSAHKPDPTPPPASALRWPR